MIEKSRFEVRGAAQPPLGGRELGDEIMFEGSCGLEALPAGLEKLDELRRAFALDDGFLGDQAVFLGVAAGARLAIGALGVTGGGGVRRMAAITDTLAIGD